MADGACDFTDEVHGRNWIITRLSPPTTIELCDEHLAPGLTPILAAELGIEFETLYANLDRLLRKEAARAAKELAAAEQAEAAGDDPNKPDDPDRSFTPEDNGPVWDGAGPASGNYDEEPAS